MKIFTKIQRYPDSLVFFITNRCNLKCEHCFFKDSVNKKNDELTLDEIKKIASKLKGSRNLIITGGEPFVRDDIAEICNIFQNKKRVLRICTNGTLLDKIQKNIKKIHGFKLITLQISLEGEKKENDMIRGKGNFDRTIKTIKSLKNCNIEIACTLNKYNIHSSLKLLDLGYPMVFIPMQWKKGCDMSLFPAIEDLEYVYKKTKGRVSLRNRLILKHAIENMRTNKRSVPCFAGSIDATMYSNGDIAFCEMTQPIGNIREYNYSFIKTWRSKIAQKRRKEIKKCCCVNACNLSTGIAMSYDLSNNTSI